MVIPAPYSITSSARARSVAGNSRPSASAVLRLMTSSNFVGCTIAGVMEGRRKTQFADVAGCAEPHRNGRCGGATCDAGALTISNGTRGLSRSSWPNGLRGDNPKTYKDHESAQAAIAG